MWDRALVDADPRLNARLMVAGSSPAARRLYRRLRRELGMDRTEANVIVFGFVLGEQQPRP